MKLTPLRRLALVMLALAAVVLPAHGQTSPAGFPDIHPDRTVTFRISAPKATEVTLTTDWLANQKMEKGADGVWSVTVGPLAPTIYIYSFTVDGVAMADPVNPRMKLRARTSASVVEVPATTPTPWEVREVPHGTVAINWHKSAVLNGETRQFVVYTPPGYEQDPARRYPVLYLLHGTNDTALGWTTVGSANFIFDNLLAEQKAVPMIVVMPYGHAAPYGERGGGGANNTTLFESYLLKEVMPLVEAKYRVAPGRESRAIAGLSMGAEQSLYLFFHHLDLFSSVGAFCPSGFPAIETGFPDLLNDPAATNAKIALLWLGCGRQDPQHFPGTERLANALTAHQITHIWHPTEGYHNYAVWRDYLVEFAPLLFRAPAKS